MPPSLIRNIQPSEITTLPANLEEWTSGFIEAPATKNVIASRGFDQSGCFVAEEKGAIVGCVAVTRLPRKNWLVVRYLAARWGLSRVDAVEKLLSRALEYAEAKKPEFLRATTPSTQPYVDVYKSFGFKPIRRDFRITWDLGKSFTTQANKEIQIAELTEKAAKEAANDFVESLKPYWDWRIEEQGGKEAVADNFLAGFHKGERWLSGSIGKQPVCFGGLIPNYYGPAEGRFRGTFVVPKHRGRGIGRTVMSEAEVWARKLGQIMMTVYTFSYLDSLAPGAMLYIKSGGKIESEYLQLQRVT